MAGRVEENAVALVLLIPLGMGREMMDVVCSAR
jgi:hypothetical protein